MHHYLKKKKKKKSSWTIKTLLGIPFWSSGLELQALTSEGPGAIPGQGTKIPQLCSMAKKQTKDRNKKNPQTSYIIWKIPVNPELWPPESHYFEEDVTFLPNSNYWHSKHLNWTSYIWCQGSHKQFRSNHKSQTKQQ